VGRTNGAPVPGPGRLIISTQKRGSRGTIRGLDVTMADMKSYGERKTRNNNTGHMKIE